MLKHHSKLVAGIVLLSFSVVGLFAQANADWQEGEYPLFDAANKETDPAKKLPLLMAWKQKHPDAKLKMARAGAFLETYRQLNRGEDMYQTAKEILAASPEEPNSLMWVTLLTKSLAKKAPADLDFGEKVSNQFIGILDKTFGSNKAQRDGLEVSAHQTLAYVHDSRGAKPKAEEEYKKALGVMPNQGALSFEYGRYIVALKDPTRYSEALWHLTRGANLEGAGAIPPASKADYLKYTNGIYTQLHGSAEGMPELVQQAKASVFPPAGFKVLSAGEVAAKKQEELEKSNPDLAKWKVIKDGLIEDPNYWGNLKDSLMPPLKAKVISSSPATRPKEVTVGISSDTEGEIKLVFETPYATAVPVGTELTFEGVAKDFSKSPFLLTVEVEKTKLTGWPAPARGGTTKKGAAPKAGKGKG